MLNELRARDDASGTSEPAGSEAGEPAPDTSKADAEANAAA